MYPNQGYPGQNVPFGAGYPSAQQGYPPMPQPGYGQPPMPQPGYGQPPMPQPGFGQPQMPQLGHNPPFGAGYPSVQQAYQPMPQSGYGQPPMPQPGFGQPQMPPSGYGQPPMPQQGFGQPNMPPQPNYGSPSHTAYPQVPNAPPYQGGMPVQQVQQYAQSYGAPPTVTNKGRPTVTPAPNFDASNDAAALRKAMKGFGTDEDGLINVLCRRPAYQRVEIVRAYKTAYGKDLANDIKSETSGNFQLLLLSLLMSKEEYYCRELYEACVGVGTDEDVLIEVMCTMSNQEIREIGALYTRMFGATLESHLRSDTSGCMKRLMTSLSVGGRDESMITDVNSARQDAEALKRAGVGRFGTDESEFNRILCLRNYEQLNLICAEYEKLTGNSLEKDIKKEFSGDIEDALLAIIRAAKNKPEFFARRLHKSMAGLGTNDRSLIRLCIMRCDVDMMDVKEEFQRYYGKSLKSFIKGDTSGHYKHALYALCGENRS